MSAETVTPTLSPEPEDTGILPHSWTKDEFFRAFDLGLFEGRRVELLQGEVFDKLPQNPPHIYSVRQTQKALERAFGEAYLVYNQATLPLEDESIPDPDVMVVRGTEQELANRYATMEEVALVVEVSDTTLRVDRTRKAASYALSGIPEYWIVNVRDRKLRVHRRPTPARTYDDVTDYEEGDAVSPLSAPHAVIAVINLLPPPKPGD